LFKKQPLIFVKKAVNLPPFFWTETVLHVFQFNLKSSMVQNDGLVALNYINEQCLIDNVM